MKKLLAILGILLLTGAVSADETKGGKPKVPKPPIGAPVDVPPKVEQKMPLADMTAKVISVDASAKTLTFIELPKKAKPGDKAAGSAPVNPTDAAASNQTLTCEGTALEALGKIKGGETVRITFGDMKGEAGVMEGHKVITKIKVINASEKKDESKASHS